MKKQTYDQVANSSLNEDWPTNQEWFDEWHAEFGFTLDPCANIINHKCPKFYTIDDNGLSKSWRGERCFINPPYNNLYDWVKKAFLEMLHSSTFSVMFIPARTNRRFFHDFVWDPVLHRFRPGVSVRFFAGDMKFTDSAGPCPFGLMLVIFDPTKL